MFLLCTLVVDILYQGQVKAEELLSFALRLVSPSHKKIQLCVAHYPFGND